MNETDTFQPAALEPHGPKPARQSAEEIGRSFEKRALDPQRKSLWYESLIHFCWWSVVKAGLRLWNRLEVDGRENLPRQGPMVLIANHVSHIDCLALAAAIAPRRRTKIVPMAAADVFFPNRLLAVLSSTILNALPVRRTGKACGLHAMRQYRKRLLEHDEIYILFPEGLLSRDGLLKPFKGGIGVLVAGTTIPVVPCYLEGAAEALAPGTHFVRPKKIRVTIGQPIAFERTPNSREGWTHIAETLEARVKNLGATAATREELPLLSRPLPGWY